MPNVYPDLNSLIGQLSGRLEAIVEKPSIKNDELFGHIVGACPDLKVHIITQSRAPKSPNFKYMVLHEYLHIYLIMERGYVYIPHDVEIRDPEKEIIYDYLHSFCHHFSINQILTEHNCKELVKEFYDGEYQYLKNIEEFDSISHEFGRILYLIECDFWLKNNCREELKEKFREIGSGQFDNLLNISLGEYGESLFTGDGAKKLFVDVQKKLGYPLIQFERMKLERSSE